MTYYNEQLQMLREKVSRKKYINNILSELHSQKQALEEKVNELDNIREKEQKDVEKLEKKSITTLLYEMTGKKEEKLDKEKAEAYAAVLKYENAVSELKQVDEEIIRYQNELSDICDCDREYERILKEKTEAIKASDMSEAKELLKIEERLIVLKSQKKEINEAISAGNKARDITDDLLSDLSSAKGWGTWDLFGGGLISDMAKHGYLDDAQQKVEHLQSQLRRFKTELADVTVYADFHVNCEGFLRFADYFFDGIFVDWTILDKISESQSQVERTKEQISEVLNKLFSSLSKIEVEQTQLKNKLDELVVKL